ncbi:beta-hydroxyacyl-ACP dehydratase [bacterium]|jgi:3-hydroxyacyl-[acyl-carrier-protein] dehydratase|nr:beta-hydroxyacyl-ACP dehydratase [bacterium]
MRWIWIDRFEEFHSGVSAVAIKMISMAEDHLYEQTPAYPVMPHSLILEGLAQTGGILLGEANGFAEKVVLAKITSARFFDHATPGDELRYEAKLVDNRSEGGLAECRVLKNGELMAEAEIFFAHVDNARSSEMDLPQENFVFGKGHLVEMIKRAKGTTSSPKEESTS